MKTNKTKSQVKDSQKAAKKELQKNLADKFIEAVKSLGHDAGQIGTDLLLVSKFVAKKLAKKTAKTESKPAEPSVSATPVKKQKAGKKTNDKAVKKARKIVEKASANSGPVVNSVKVSQQAEVSNIDKPKADDKPLAAATASKSAKVQEAASKATRPKATGTKVTAAKGDGTGTSGKPAAIAPKAAQAAKPGGAKAAAKRSGPATKK